MITNLKQLYLHQIEDLHSAENQILKAMPKMIARTQDENLREAFSAHLEETRHHLGRLNEILGSHGGVSAGKRCEAIEGILKEGEHLIDEMGGTATDAGLIAAAQRVEHYEIAAYGTAREFAEKLDLTDDAKLLDETLQEEGHANKRLTKIATGGFFGSGVNDAAVAS
jgi:ferritin-like metal-binding protein YciE